MDRAEVRVGFEEEFFNSTRRKEALPLDPTKATKPILPKNPTSVKDFQKRFNLSNFHSKV